MERSSAISGSQKTKQTIRMTGNVNGSFLNGDDSVIIPDIDSQSFNNLIKEVTANQMTDADVWNVRLIDYFAEMKHLQTNGNSINFQTAGAALQGCVSVLSKKIDFAVHGANKLIRGLAIPSNGVEVDDSDEDGDDPEFKLAKKKKKKPHRIETDPYKVSIVSFNRFKTSDRDQLFEMRDPVFMKFIAAFDEGGAKALLTNTLRIDSSCRVCINDVTTRLSTVEDVVTKRENDEEGYLEENTQSSIVKDDEDEGEEDQIMDENHIANEMQTTISSLSLWSQKSNIFTLDNVDLCSQITNIKKSIEDEEYGREYVKSTMDKIEETQSSFLEPKFDYDIADFYDDNDNSNAGVNNNDINIDNDDAPNFEMPDNDPNMSTSSQRISKNETLGMGSNDFQMTQEEEELNNNQQLQVMKSLDEKFKHRSKKSQWRKDWKINNVLSKNVKTTQFENALTPDIDDQMPIDTNFEQPPEIKKQQTSKENLIDFLNGKDVFSIFEEPHNKIERSIVHKENTLNDENTWSSERLVRSFIKPKRKFRNMFTRKNKIIPVEIDQAFWAKQYNDRETTEQFIDEDAADFLNEAMDDGEQAAINSNHDLLESNGMDDDLNDANGYDFDAPVDFDLPSSSFVDNYTESSAPSSSSAAASRERRAIQFAKRSKRVDVKLLKKNLSDVIHHVHLKDEPQEFYEGVNEEDEHKRKRKVNIKLSDVVKDTAIKYDSYQRNELSTSFYFICMLHLANEQGFSIESTEDDDDVIITGDTIVIDE